MGLRWRDVDNAEEMGVGWGLSIAPDTSMNNFVSVHFPSDSIHFLKACKEHEFFTHSPLPYHQVNSYFWMLNFSDPNPPKYSKECIGERKVLNRSAEFQQAPLYGIHILDFSAIGGLPRAHLVSKLCLQWQSSITSPNEIILISDWWSASLSNKAEEQWGQRVKGESFAKAGAPPSSASRSQWSWFHNFSVKRKF